jgi:RNA polymerase primary sigma factor
LIAFVFVRTRIIKKSLIETDPLKKSAALGKNFCRFFPTGATHGSEPKEDGHAIAWMWKREPTVMASMNADCTKRADAPSFDLYLTEIQLDSLLTQCEERTLAHAIASGDDQARGRMIRANLRLVVKIARDYVGRGLSFEDLVGEGNLGLIRAAEEFDPRFGVRFSTYAAYWIKQAIRHALTTTSSTIRLPAHMITMLSRWRRAERSLRRRLGRTPEANEIADDLALTSAQRIMVDRAQGARKLRQESSIDPQANWSPDEAPDPHAPPQAHLEETELRDELLRRISALEPREQKVLAYRYGLDGQSPLTLMEVGRRLGVTREWVRKIEQKALRKLIQQMVPDDLPPRTTPRPAPRSRPLAVAARTA